LGDGESAVLDRYHVLEELGRGGAGTVFKAWDTRLERLVAIKILDREIRDSPERLEPLLVEARTCAALHHPHIVTVYDIDTENGFLVQELMAGGSLRDLLEMVASLPAIDVLTLAEQLGSALSAAHRAGVVHRDLKPENVLLAMRPPLRGSPAGVFPLPPVKLADFGTALRIREMGRLSERRAVAGTLAYMAPEQLAGEETGPAADLFSLGVVLHECRHGTRPVHTGSSAGAADRAEAPTDTDDPLHRLVTRCLEWDPEHRFPTADDFLAAVGKAQQRTARGAS
ncbi:MAG: serine/threonine protein kinase, partial [Holophagales bacterium]|nr:serine/threonine protein kinase [Holophagales bacterium]